MPIFGSQDVRLGGQGFISSTAQQFELGTRGYTRDGRAFRYVSVGAVALVAGEVIQSAATIAGHQALAVNTTSGGVTGAMTVISLTCSSSVGVGFYNEGYLMVASGAGQGLTYQIKSHPAVSTGATGAFTLYDEDAITVSITTTSTVSLIANKYKNVIEAPVTTATGVVIGVAPYAIGVTQFGWIQTWGPCAVRGGDTNAVGTAVDGVASTAGRARGYVQAAANVTTNFLGSVATGQPIGYLMSTNVDGQWIPVDLRIAP